MKMLSGTIRCFLVLLFVTFSANMMWGQEPRLPGKGTIDEPYYINNDTDWQHFAYDVADGIDYANQYVRLDINLNTDIFVGSASWTESIDQSFNGIFNGNGHTITINYTSNYYQKDFHKGLFRCLNNATIVNLRVEGNIYIHGYHSYFGNSNDIDRYSAGLACKAKGSNLISNCRVAVTITAKIPDDVGYENKDTNSGGYVGLVANGCTVFSNCLFEGRLLGGNSGHSWGGFVGEAQGAVYFNHCLFSPAQINVDLHECATFARGNAFMVFDTAIYNSTMGSVQGIDGRSMSVDEAVEILGSDNWYKVNNRNYALSKQNVTCSPMSGTGIYSDPYLISSPVHWRFLADKINKGEYRNKYIKLTKDIVVSKMVGTSDSKYFSGNFDGDGHSIKFAQGTKSEYCAPFRYIKNATIKNLQVTGSVISTKKYVGGIAGRSDGTNTIEKCISSVNINSSVNGDGSHGGFIGQVESGNTTISYCLFNGKIIGTKTEKCGGFIGWVDDDAKARLNRCLFNPAELNTDPDGHKTFARTDESEDLALSHCYYKTPFGGAQGINGSALTTDELVTALSEYFWQNTNDVALPKVGVDIEPFPTGTGTPDAPYKITNAANWNYMVAEVNAGNCFNGKCLKLDADIDVIYMVGNKDYPFKGNFDGNGHTINVTLYSLSDYTAPFRYVQDATITGLNVEGSLIVDTKYAGGIVARAIGTVNIMRCRSNVTINSSVSGDGTHGGLVSHTADGSTITISNSLFDGRIIGNNTEKCGGFVGYANNNVTLTNCLFDPTELTLDQDGHKTFARMEKSSKLTTNNSYYTATMGDSQGTSGIGKTAEELVSLLGSSHWQVVENKARPKMETTDGSGNEDDPYLIGSDEKWNSFAAAVSGGEAYEGKFFLLTSDITVNTMAGSENMPFKGIFDGGGHTITLNLSNGGNTTSLFGCLFNATVKNIRLTGTITTNNMRPASVAGFVDGTWNSNPPVSASSETHIINCYSDVAISSSYNNDIDAGGIVGAVDKGETVVIEGCSFTGSITYTHANGYEGGSFVGWTRDNSQAIITNCFFAPSTISITKKNGFYLFVGGNVRGTFTNCYYKDFENMETLVQESSPNVKHVHSVNAGENTTFVINEAVTNGYSVPHLEYYGNVAVSHEGTLYAANGDVLGLNIDYDNTVFTATAETTSGSITGNANPYTLTMGDNNAVITVILTENTFNTAGEWGVASNWSTRHVPAENNGIRINAPVTIPDGYIAYADKITMLSGGSITIEDGGQLYCNSSVPVTMQKTTGAWTTEPDNGWYLIASPVKNLEISTFAPASPQNYNVYRYDERDLLWQEHRNEANSFDSLTSGCGYLYRSTVDNMTFTGNLNVRDIEVQLSYACIHEDYKGFNIIGNPYSHHIVRDENFPSYPLEDKYYTLSTNGTWDLTENNVPIAPTQAILVQAKDATNLVITSTAYSPDKRMYSNNDNITFTVKNNNFTDKACVEFKAGRGLNKIEHRNEHAPMLYVNYNDERFASVDIPDDTKVIDLRFESKNMSQYTLTVNANGDFSYLHLIDKVAGEDIDMLANDSYTFVGSSTDDKDRFEVVLRYNADPASTPTETFAYQSGNDIIVSGEGELQVFDVMGRMVMTQHVSGVQTVEKPSQCGVYILKLNEKTQKIVIR